MDQQRPDTTKRPFWLSAFFIVVAVYIITSFLHGSPWFWIRMAALLILLIAALVAAVLSLTRSGRRKIADGR